MFHQFGSFAQYERELIGKRIRFGMIKRLQEGLWNGIPPYGYRIVGGKLVVESKEADLGRRFSGGIYSRTWVWWPSAGS